MTPKKTILHIFLLLLLSLILLPQANAERIVRVGWYNFPPLSIFHPEAAPAGSDLHEDIPGVYGGYNYEYLRMISQINGWKLRFYYGTINECLDWLEAGNLDLVGGVGRIPSREQRFAFPVNSALRTSIGLIVRADDTRFTMNDFETMKNIRVGAVADSNPLFQIQQWSRQRNIPMQFQPYSSFSEMYAALDAGSVDAVTDSLLMPLPTRKILASIESPGAYFISNKNNSQLLQELDDAITEIQYLKPGYQETLSAKYLYSQSYSSFTLSRREQTYLDSVIASGVPIRVAFAANWIPIEYMDPKTGNIEGIMADVFSRIQQLTGLPFEYIPETDSPQADIIATLSTDFAWADRHQAYLSQSVFEAPVFMVSTAEAANFNVVALLQGTYIAELVKSRLESEGQTIHCLYFDTAAACLDAVKAGTAGRTYLNAYELNYYMNQNKYMQLKSRPVPGLNETTSIGISKTANPLLCSILCQALRSIPPAEMNSIILKNTTFRPQHTFVDFIYLHPLESLAGAVILVLLVGGTLFFYYSSRKNKRLRQELEDMLRSRTSLLQANEELNHLSQYDSLTNIPNRRGLDEFINRVYASSDQFILVMMDIDEFKSFNDTYGHPAGDNALAAIGKILSQHAIVTASFTARFGGEEFIWIDTIHVRKAVQLILKKLMRDIDRQNILHEGAPTGKLTISIGYAEKQPGETFEALLARADEALYQAKRQGRNQIVYHPAEH